MYALNVNKNFALLVNGILNLMGMVGDIMVKTDLVIRSGVWSEGLEPIEGDILGTIISDILKWLLSDGVNAHYVRSLGAVLSLAAPYFWGYSYSSFLIFLRDPETKCGAEDRDIVFERWVFFVKSIRSLNFFDVTCLQVLGNIVHQGPVGLGGPRRLDTPPARGLEEGYGGGPALPHLQQDGAQGEDEGGDGVQPRQGQAQVLINEGGRLEVTFI